MSVRHNHDATDIDKMPLEELDVYMLIPISTLL